MEHFIEGNIDEFLATFVHTIAIAGCLAFGISTRLFTRSFNESYEIR